MTTYEWAALRDTATKAFNGETPRAPTEQAIVDIFETNPTLVAAAITRVAAQYATGSIRSGWAVLKADLERTTTQTRNPTVTDGPSRDKRTRQAEQWIRTAGIHHDRPAELEDDLFGYQGLLEPWANDDMLRARMIGLWSTQRPRGEQVELEAIQRGLRHQEARKRAAELRKPPEPVAAPS